MPKSDEMILIVCFNSDGENTGEQMARTIDEALELAAGNPDCVSACLEDDWEYIPVLHKVLSI